MKLLAMCEIETMIISKVTYIEEVKMLPLLDLMISYGLFANF